MIWNVFVADLGWFCLVILLHEISQTKHWTFAIHLTKLMVFYVTLEVLFHGVMEDFVANYIF